MPLLLALTALLAFSAPAQAFDPGRVITRALTAGEIKTYERTATALSAAAAVYHLPNLSSGVKTADYLASFQKFFASTPKHYELWGTDTDLGTGLKFVIYRPLSTHPEGAEAPWVLSITGTENLLDWLTNASLGKPQFLGLDNIITLFTTNLVPDRELIVTGHSLGGGLAQAVAHAIEAAREEKSLQRRPITLLTWNAFGAETLIERIGAYRPELAQRMTIQNYYLQGDEVSQIGRHFGPTFEIIPPVRPDGNSALAEVLRLHSLSAFEEVIHQGRGKALREARLMAPPSAKVINSLTRISWLLSPFAGTIHEFRQLWTIRWIRARLDAATAQDLRNPLVLAAYRYLYNAGVTEEKRLKKENHRDKAWDLGELRRSLHRFHALLPRAPRS